MLHLDPRHPEANQGLGAVLSATGDRDSARRHFEIAFRGRAGIDFGLNSDGDVLLFEANATMVVNPPDAGEQWDYRRRAVCKILDAVNAMILRKASQVKSKRAG